MAEFTWFIDDGDTENRKYLYKLENLRIFTQEKTKEEGFYNYKWKLTERGKKLIKLNDKLRILFEKRDFKEFYRTIEEEILP